MTSSHIDTSLRRLRGNLLGNLGHFVVGVSVGLWMTPFLVSHLGVETYGLVPLATNITSYMAIITVALSGSVGRFLAVDVARGDSEGANQTFNTSLGASLILAFLLLPVVAVLAWFGPTVLDVPKGQEDGTRWLLMAAGVAFLANAVGGSFAASAFARNRLDLQRSVEAIGMLANALCILVLFTIYKAALWQVGLALLVVAAVRQIGHVILWRKLTPEVHIAPSLFARTKLRELLSMGGWLTVNEGGALLFHKAELLVVNLVLGARAAGLYAPLLQWSVLLRTMTGIASGVFTPMFIAYHAWERETRLITTAQGAVKMLGLVMALPIGLIAGLSEPLLLVWLGDEYARMWPVLILITAHLCINLTVRPLFGVNQALNRLGWPAVYPLATGITGIGLAIWLAGPVGWDLYGVALGGAIALTAKNALFTPLYASRILGCPWHTFLWGLVPAIIGTALVAVSARALAVSVDLVSWPRLIAAGVGISALYATAVYSLALRAAERQQIARLLRPRAE